MSQPRALLFDIGNTRLKWGLLKDGQIVRTGMIAHEDLRAAGFSTLLTRLPRRVDQAIASNVAGPSFATRLTAAVGLHCGRDLRFARTAREAYGVTNSYRSPRRLGVDRWFAMIGARAEFRSALCVVDAGTAITIDVVDKSGQHLGGQIMPGLNLLVAALGSNTSDIPAQRRAPKPPGEGMQMFASSTAAAVSNGAFNAVTGAIERAMRNVRSASLRPKLVLTGGDASRILSQLDSSCHHRPHLVLQGLAQMIDYEK